MSVQDKRHLLWSGGVCLRLATTGHSQVRDGGKDRQQRSSDRSRPRFQIAFD